MRRTARQQQGRELADHLVDGAQVGEDVTGVLLQLVLGQHVHQGPSPCFEFLQG